MIKKKKASLILVILMVMLLLFGCAADGQNSILKNEEISEDIKDGLSTTDTLLEENNQDKITNINEDIQEDLKVHFINVGQGSSTFIVGPDGKTMLYDAGGEDETSGRVVVDYIKSIGYEYIDVAIFTHPHSDHINGAPTVLQELKVDSVYYPKVTHTTRTFEKFVEAVKNAGLKFKTAKAGVEIPFGETDAILVAPLSNQYENINDYSVTVKLTWKGKSILLTGDVEKISEKEMINSEQDLNIDLLLVPHHGSNSSTTDEFLDKTTPDYAVISSGKDNSYGHPHKEVMYRLNKRNIKTYNTAEVGNIIAILNEKEISIITTEENNNIENTNETPYNQSSKKTNIPKEKTPTIDKLEVTASISDPNPKQNSNIVLTAKVTSNDNPVEGAKVEILNYYKSKTTSYEGLTNKDGLVEIPYDIGRASLNFEVKVDVKVTKENLEAKTQVSFTPQ